MDGVKVTAGERDSRMNRLKVEHLGLEENIAFRDKRGNLYRWIGGKLLKQIEACKGRLI